MPNPLNLNIHTTLFNHLQSIANDFQHKSHGQPMSANLKRQNFSTQEQFAKLDTKQTMQDSQLEASTSGTGPKRKKAGSEALPPGPQ
jgi:hypothetical protein